MYLQLTIEFVRTLAHVNWNLFENVSQAAAAELSCLSWLYYCLYRNEYGMFDDLITSAVQRSDKHSNETYLDEPGPTIAELKTAKFLEYIMVTGWPLSDELYDLQMSKLVKVGFRAISLRIHGYDRLGTPLRFYNYRLSLPDIIAIRSQLDLNVVKLHGREVGGAVAIHYFLRRSGRFENRLALFAAPASSNAALAHQASEEIASSDLHSIEELQATLPITPESIGSNSSIGESYSCLGDTTWFLLPSYYSHATQV
jgi:hypothetical protein